MWREDKVQVIGHDDECMQAVVGAAVALKRVEEKLSVGLDNKEAAALSYVDGEEEGANLMGCRGTDMGDLRG